MHTPCPFRHRRPLWFLTLVAAVASAALSAGSSPLPVAISTDPDLQHPSDSAHHWLPSPRDHQVPLAGPAVLEPAGDGSVDLSWLDELPVVPENRRGHVYLIRHAEKGKGVHLSPDGELRSWCLTDLFTTPAGKAAVEAAEPIQAERRKKHRKPRTYRHDTLPVVGLVAQQFKKDGRRERPYATLVPLGRKLGLPIHHACDREDARCVQRVAERFTHKGQNVLISWQHTAMTDIAAALGIRKLFNPPNRYDIVFDLRRHKVHSITSQECRQLDEHYIGWRGRKVFSAEAPDLRFNDTAATDDGAVP